MVIKSHETYINAVTGFECPCEVIKTEGSLVACDAEFFYVSIPFHYECGVPVVSKYNRRDYYIAPEPKPNYDPLACLEYLGF